jgi:hypothetical protein
MDAGEDEGFEVAVGDARGLRVFAFCPLCAAQATAYTYGAAVEFVVEHMNEFHALPDDPRAVRRQGNA